MSDQANRTAIDPATRQFKIL